MAEYRKLGKKTKLRKALLRSQVTALLYNGKIITTEARAKEIQKAQKAVEAGEDPVEKTAELKDVLSAIKAAFPELDAAGYDPEKIGFGSTIFAVKPGDGSAREQASQETPDSGIFVATTGLPADIASIWTIPKASVFITLLMQNSSQAP